MTVIEMKQAIEAQFIRKTVRVTALRKKEKLDLVPELPNYTPPPGSDFIATNYDGVVMKVDHLAGENPETWFLFMKCKRGSGEVEIAINLERISEITDEIPVQVPYSPAAPVERRPL